MASSYLTKGLKRSALTVALGFCFAAGVQAQTNTAGAVTGRAAAGDTITISNPATGFNRTITVDSTGSYRFSQLPTGQYQVSRNGGATRTVNVNVGTVSNADFVTTGGDATTLEGMTVTGTGTVNPIDVSSVESTTIITAEQIKAIPVANNATAVALLAPGTVRGDSAFGNLASFGGSSVAENQYFLNGFNITNTFRNLNYSQVPFEGIAEQQVKTGGYGAEFGRSLGGVINQISKRGTNDFKAGANIYWSPKALSEPQPDTYYSNPLTPSDFGKLRSDNSRDNGWAATANLWAGGALIKDRLFYYGLLSYARTASDAWGTTLATTNSHSENKNPKWLVKLDWNITDNHLLEFTGFSDKQKNYSDTYFNTRGVLDRLGYVGQTINEQGGSNYVLKYTGYLTDNFTISALAGHGEFSRATYLLGPTGQKASYDGNIASPAQQGCPVVVDGRLAAQQNLTGTYSSKCNISGGTMNRFDSGDTRDQFRVDAEWQLGNHLIRGGYDRDDFTSIAGVALEGGFQWTYQSLTPPAGTTKGQDIVQKQYFSQGATVEVKQHAFYLEDSWSITNNFIAYMGLRWDTFENINGDGQTYVKIKNQFGPRLGFSWDVNGDGGFKVFGNAGRYALPLTPSVAVRGASASLFSRETFTFSGVDPVTGVPINPVSRGDFFYLNGEDGHPKNPMTIASANLTPMYQDEYILGFQKQLTDTFSLGVRGIHRDLKAAIDDNCDYVALLETAGFEYDGHGWVRGGKYAKLPSSGLPYCRMFNPGADAIWLSDFFANGTMESTTIPGDRLSPKAKRKYQAMEIFFEHMGEKLFLQGSYTFARGKGNTEGGVKSDIGQADTSVTQDFDYKELTVDTYGYLPNDRRHSLKLFGKYDWTEEWSTGFNFIVQSGRPLNCLGVLDLNPLPPVYNADGSVKTKNYRPHQYGSSFMRCGTTVNGGYDDKTVVARPRGTMGRLPWTNSLDLNVAYKPMWLKGLTVKADVFNVFNRAKTTSVVETAEVRSTGLPSNTYMLPASFQSPRSLRLMVQYEF